jgi:Putative inner membrane protein (DUF1819)
MIEHSRAKVVSSFTVIKGTMIPETYSVFVHWDLTRSKHENLDRLRSENPIGAQSATWLRDVVKVLSRRFDPDGRDRALVLLAQRGCPLDEWKPILLWHITRDEFLLRDFLIHWLYPQFEAGVLRVRPTDLDGFLLGLRERGGQTEHAWSEATQARVAAGLLKAAADFGLLRGTGKKEFASYHLPERSFLYMLHAVQETAASPARVIAAEDWRMFLMAPQDVEREILRLHQYKKLHYEAAGSLLQLTLPRQTALEFAEGM